MDGLILIDKPQDCTSHDIVVQIRNILDLQNIGHFGTLDPSATGLLLIAVGKATRLFPFYSKENKTYKGRLRLGFSTDTYDYAGKPTSSLIEGYPPKEEILAVMNKFEGEIYQVPPPFSAKKYKGKPLYKLAREKKEFPLKPNKVFIYFFHLRKYAAPYLDFEVKCSSGTYVRSLAHDLGQILGCGAHIWKLVRTEVGDFKLRNGFNLEKITNLTKRGKIEKFLLPLESLLPQFPKVILEDSGSTLAKNGSMIFPENMYKVFPGESSSSSHLGEKETIFRLFNLEGKLLALAKRAPQKNSLFPFLVIH